MDGLGHNHSISNGKKVWSIYLFDLLNIKIPGSMDKDG